MTDDFALSPSEALDSDQIRNDDGDEVADPPERWIEAKDGETLDERLADEEPDIDVDYDEPGTGGATDAHDSDAGGGLDLMSDDALDRIDPEHHGRDSGQICGSPEDGESFFGVID